jgi:3',5'-cyclic AMP phosphodiesterase CpdA
MAIFSLLHMSDLHLGRDSTKISIFDDRVIRNWRQIIGPNLSRVGLQHTHCSTLAQEVARTIWDQSFRLDALIISGDIATTGMYQDLLAGLQFIAARPNARKRHLTSLGEGTIFNSDGPEVLLMPGNHDRFHDSFGTPGSPNFETVFFNYWDKSDRVKATVLMDDESEDHLAVVLADFSLRKIGDASPPVYFPGQGLAHEDVLKKLILKTKHIRIEHKKAGVIWVIHFPPSATDSDYSESLMLLGYRDVLRAAMVNNISIILSGHIHVNKTFPPDNGVVVSCAASACCYIERYFDGNWIHILDLEVNDKSAQIKTREDFKFDDKQDWRFKYVPPKRP